MKVIELPKVLKNKLPSARVSYILWLGVLLVEKPPFIKAENVAVEVIALVSLPLAFTTCEPLTINPDLFLAKVIAKFVVVAIFIVGLVVRLKVAGNEVGKGMGIV